MTPSLNQAAFISDTLESVLGQTGVHVEYLVVDGGSVDGTVEKIRSVADRLAFFRSTADAGQAAALNDGFARSTGDILCWLNSDDMLLPGALEFVARTLDPSQPQLIFGNCLVIVEGEAEVHGSDALSSSVRKDLRYDDYIVQPAAFWTRRLWEATGSLDETLTWAFDWDWFIRAQSAASRFEAVGRYLAVYRKHDSHKTAVGGDPRRAEIKEVLRRYAGDNAAQASTELWEKRVQIERWRWLNFSLVPRFWPSLLRSGLFGDFRHVTYDQLIGIANAIGVRI